MLITVTGSPPPLCWPFQVRRSGSRLRFTDSHAFQLSSAPTNVFFFFFFYLEHHEKECSSKHFQEVEKLRVALRLRSRSYTTYRLRSRPGNRTSPICYTGRVTRVEPSLEAPSAKYGAQRHGSCRLKEVAKEYLGTQLAQSRPQTSRSAQGSQELIVQVEKEERGNQGRRPPPHQPRRPFLVLMPIPACRRGRAASRAKIARHCATPEWPDDTGRRSPIVRTARGRAASPKSCNGPQ